MLFNSYIFVLVFLPVSLLIYYVLNYFKFRKISMALLVLFSLVFYSYLKLPTPIGLLNLEKSIL